MPANKTVSKNEDASDATTQMLPQIIADAAMLLIRLLLTK
ncbi:hypothetical protein CVS40_9493 [Lucilia cuprina]|nr:hypothetical protein CVS40_9493 [Lucilia cuprina]